MKVYAIFSFRDYDDGETFNGLYRSLTNACEVAKGIMEMQKDEFSEIPKSELYDEDVFGLTGGEFTVLVQEVEVQP